VVVERKSGEEIGSKWCDINTIYLNGAWLLEGIGF
jgi:hypothetical protein